MCVSDYKLHPEFYLQIRYTAEQLIQSQETLTPDTISFISQFNTLNRSLNIDYQIDIPIESMQLANKPRNLGDVIKSPESVLAYESVRTYTNNQPNIIDKPKESLQINTKLKSDIRNTLPDQTKESVIGKIKETCKANKVPVPVILSGGDSRSRRIYDNKRINPFNNQGLQGEEKLIGDIINQALQETSQNYLINQTNTILKKQVILQAISGLARYFDTTTDGQNYADDFDLSTDGNIDIQNNILHISGQMHGQIVHFFYNLETGELQANDYLYKVLREDTFYINDIEQGKVTLPTKIPTIQTLQQDMKNTEYKTMIERSNTIADYQNQLRRTSNTLQKRFDTQNYNKAYIARMNEKNLFIQETLDNINTNSGGGFYPLQIAGRNINLDNSPQPIRINRSLNPNEYELLLLLDRTSQHYRHPEQLRTIRSSMTQLQQYITDPLYHIRQANHADPVINKLFNQQALIQDRENRNNPNKKNNFLRFLDLVSIPFNQAGGGVIDISLLQKVLQRIQNNEPIAITENPKPIAYQSDPRYFNEKYENILNNA